MSNTVSGKRYYIFYAVSFMIPLLFFVMLEVGLRLFDYGDTLDLFIPAPANSGNEPYVMTNPLVAQRYFPKNHHMPKPPHETFRRDKPANGYRIFVLGGSTAATWPYPGNVLFSRILAQRLSDAFPDRYIEVVNLGIAAVNSFTLVDFMSEVLASEPDALLIYTGHNEFYGALGAASSQTVGQSRWLIKTYLALLKLKTVQLIRDAVNEAGRYMRPDSDQQFSTLMGRMVGDTNIAYGGDTYGVAKSNFEANLSEILSTARQAGVPILVSELVSNLRDQRPFASVDGDGHLPADLVYAWAQMLEQEEMFDLARSAYAWARDLDGIRFRAPQSFNTVIHKVASQFNVPVVPMQAYFENASPNGIIGSTLMLEHLHPNVEGYFLMSEAFFDSMRHHSFISDHWAEDKISPASHYRQSWPVTEIDRALGDIRIVNLTDHWPYPPKEHGARSIASFQPRDISESLAFRVFKHELTYMDAHLEMAKYYDDRQQRELARREYLALISAAPRNVNYYLTTIKHMLEWKEFSQALPLLYVSLDIKETPYARKWIGQIHLMQRQPQLALPFLEQALSLMPDDGQLVFNLGVAYLLSEQVEAAHRMVEHLENIEPSSPRVSQLKELLEAHR